MSDLDTTRVEAQAAMLAGNGGNHPDHANLQFGVYVRYLDDRGFRAGQWAKAGPLEVVRAGGKTRVLLHVTFLDGVTDQWPILDDAPGTFEFSNMAWRHA